MWQALKIVPQYAKQSVVGIASIAKVKDYNRNINRWYFRLDRIIGMLNNSFQ